MPRGVLSGESQPENTNGRAKFMEMNEKSDLRLNIFKNKTSQKKNIVVLDLIGSVLSTRFREYVRVSNGLNLRDVPPSIFYVHFLSVASISRFYISWSNPNFKWLNHHFICEPF